MPRLRPYFHFAVFHRFCMVLGLVFGSLMGVACGGEGEPTADYPNIIYFSTPSVAPEPLLNFTAETQSKTCLGCHYTQFEHWQLSYHALAVVDPAFQDAFVENGEPPMCMRCHMPVSALSLSESSGVVAPKARRPDGDNASEGVTCVSCHLDELGTIRGPTGPTEDGVAPHALVQDERFSSVEICAACHNDTVLGAFTETVEEWRSQTDGSKTCQDCHMSPKVVHRWPGGHDEAQLNQAYAVEVMGDSSGFVATVENVGAGHNIPTGDVYRAFYFTFEFVDAGGHRISQVRFQLATQVFVDGLYVEIEGDVKRREPIPAGGSWTEDLGPAPLGATSIALTVQYYTLKPCTLESLIVEDSLRVVEGGIPMLLLEKTFSLDSLPMLEN